jgi:hypothetical protein
MRTIGYQELLIFFVLVLPYLIATFGLVPYVAATKGRSGLGWVLLALLVTPLLALIALAAVPVLEEELPATSEETPDFKWRKPGENG